MATLGGPILKDKLFFFLSGEMQQRQTPARGPSSVRPTRQSSQASIDQLNSILSSKYNFAEAGTGAQVQKRQPEPQPVRSLSMRICR